MNYVKHPLSDAFPAMSEREFEAYREGVKPASTDVLKALIASQWFKGLTEDQRAIYVVTWVHWRAPGSNQHKTKVRTNTYRYAAEQTQALIQRVSRA